MTKTLTWIWKIIKWLLIIVLSVIFLVFIVLRIPATRKFIINKVTTELSQQTGTKIEIEDLDLRFPFYYGLKGVYVEQQSGDTLLHINELGASINLMPLLSKTISVNKFHITDLYADVYRPKNDSTWNYQFIIDAFATDSTTIDTTAKESSAWDFTISEIELSDINATYLDGFKGDSIKAHLGKFLVNFDEFNLSESTFRVDDIILNSTDINVAMAGEPTIEEPQEDSELPIIELNNLLLEKIAIQYSDKYMDMQSTANISSLQLKPDEIDLNNNKFHINSLRLSNSSIAYAGNKAMENNEVETTTEKETEIFMPFNIQLNELNLENNEISFYQNSGDEEKPGFNPMNFNLKPFFLNAKNIYYNSEAAGLALEKLNFIETESDFALNNFSFSVAMDKTKLEVSELNIETTNSIINAGVILDYDDPNSLLSGGPFKNGTLRIENTRLGINDAFIFSPELKADTLLGLLQNEVVDVFLDADVNYSSLNLNEVIVELRNTSFRGSATLADYLNYKNSDFNVPLFTLLTNSSDLKRFVPGINDSTLAKMPEDIEILLTAGGIVNSPNLRLDLLTQLGNVQLSANLENVMDSTGQSFDASMAVQELQWGLMTGADSSGILTMHLEAFGNEFDPAKMSAESFIVIDSLNANGYTYKDVDISAVVNNGFMAVYSQIADSNIVAQMSTSLNLDSMTDIRLRLVVDALDMQKLNFSNKDIRVRARLTAGVNGLDFSNLKGGMEMDNLLIVQDNRRYEVDSMIVRTKLTDDSTLFFLNSELIKGELISNLNVEQITNSLQNNFSQHFEFSDSIKTDIIDRNGNISLKLDVFETELLSEVLVPDLEKLEPGSLTASYSEADNNFAFWADFPFIRYSGMEVDSLNANLQSTEKQLNVALSFNQLRIDTLSLDNFKASVKANDNKLDVNISTKDSTQKSVYDINLNVENDNSRGFREQKLVLNDSILLNNKQWVSEPENVIYFSEKGIRSPGTGIKLGEQSLLFVKETYEDPLTVNAENFKLSTITGLLTTDYKLLEGSLSGMLKIHNDQALESNIKIEKLSVAERDFGTLTADIEKTIENRFNVKTELQGQGTDLNLSGYYLNAPDSAHLALDLNINSIEMKLIEVLAAGNLEGSEGSISGKIDVEGSTNNPKINGVLNFNDISTLVKPLNSTYKLQNEKIEINPTSLVFPNFTLRDSANNTAVINGRIDHNNFDNIKFNMELNTNSFKVLNTRKEHSDLLYGTVILDSRFVIKGNPDLPKITSNINLKEGSDITFIIPESEYVELDREGLVEFVNFDREMDQDILTRDKQEKKVLENTTLKGIDFTSTINVDEATGLTIVIDPVSGDRLSIKGGATASLSYSPAGVINLVGNFTIEEGDYVLTFYNLVKREFSIRTGSQLKWTGNPMNPELDLTAIYETRTSAYGLLADYTSGSAQSQDQIKQQMIFEVLLNMDGTLETPEISFAIELPEDDRGALGGRVAARLRQINENEGEVNKQVFALLILNSFISESGGDDGGNAAESAARKSASQILSQQLNKLSDKYVKGFQVNLNLDSYEGVGNQAQTDLNVDVSKTFLNDRVEVKVGSTVQLEGDDVQDANNAQNLTGNIVIQYKITPDGRYKWQVFRTTDLQDIIVGKVIKTGTGIIFTRNYNSIKELFKKPEEIDE